MTSSPIAMVLVLASLLLAASYRRRDRGTAFVGPTGPEGGPLNLAPSSGSEPLPGPSPWEDGETTRVDVPAPNRRLSPSFPVHDPIITEPVREPLGHEDTTTAHERSS